MKNRTMIAAFSCAALLAGGLASAVTPAAAEEPTDKAREYLVVLENGSLDAATKKAIDSAGGKVTDTNAQVGYVYVTTKDAKFEQKLGASKNVVGVAEERTIGHAPEANRSARSESKNKADNRGERLEGEAIKGKTAAANGAAEPLANRQWDMRQIGATPEGSYAKNKGNKQVLVGIIDTGVDGSHPDIKPNFNKALSRNFTVDEPAIDGECEVESCIDPADTDDNGHGTHVASTIGSPINGIGMSGVAPNVSLVNLRGGQDSGYFFLKGTLEALTYAGDNGIDVVNMSFYVDPWMFNCLDNPADSPAEQREQAVIRIAAQRAIDYARSKGVLPIAAMGNSATDLGNPTVDNGSPNYPEGNAHPREIDNSCLKVPTELDGVVSVSATGPSMRKSYYSDYGTEQTDVAAPGGDAYDSPTNSRVIESAILAAYPEHVARAEGSIDEDGNPTTTSVVKSCKGKKCGYYEYLQGTSMASPHAAGVAALLVAAHGEPDRKHGGLTLKPNKAEKLLYSTAQQQICPSPRTFQYTRILPDGTVAEDAHTCEGNAKKNGFYGHGIVNAYNAVQ